MKTPEEMMKDLELGLDLEKKGFIRSNWTQYKNSLSDPVCSKCKGYLTSKQNCPNCKEK